MINKLSMIGALVFFALLISLLLSYPVMLLWNYCLVPAISSVQEIGWFQAWGILLLCGFLFKYNSISFNKD